MLSIINSAVFRLYINAKSEGIIKVNDTVITQSEFDKAFDEGIDKSFLKQFGGSKNFVNQMKIQCSGFSKIKLFMSL